jgi:hypothetical protein
VFDQILLYFLIRFEDVDGEDDQAFVRELFGDVVDQRGFFFAVLAPGGPELEENDFAFYRGVVELIAVGRLGAEAGRGLAGLVAGESREVARPWGGILARVPSHGVNRYLRNSALTIPCRLRYLKDFGVVWLPA